MTGVLARLVAQAAPARERTVRPRLAPVFAAPVPDFAEPGAVFAPPPRPADPGAPTEHVSPGRRDAAGAMRQMFRPPEAAHADRPVAGPGEAKPPGARPAADVARAPAGEPLSPLSRHTVAVPSLFPEVLLPSAPQAPTPPRMDDPLAQRAAPSRAPAVPTPGETLFPSLRSENAGPTPAPANVLPGGRRDAPRPVEVTIGTIEIRTEAPREAPRPAPLRGRASGGPELMSLADYLAGGHKR